MDALRNDEARGQAGFEVKQESINEGPLSRPRAGSVKAEILAALLSGERITSSTAWARWGTSRLAGLIHQLRVSGWEIHSEEIEVKTGHGHLARVARYSMEVRHGR